MGLKLQVRGVTSAMPMNCAAAVTMAAGALQPACGCRISLILHQCTALYEMECPAQAQLPVPVKVRQLRRTSSVDAVTATSDAACVSYTTAADIPPCHQCHSTACREQHSSSCAAALLTGRCAAYLSALMSSGPKACGCAWPHCQLV